MQSASLALVHVSADPEQHPIPQRRTTAELRRGKASRRSFLSQPRLPVWVVLDDISRSSNIGAIFRLCDAFRVERLIACGHPVPIHSRKLIRAARGAQRWVPWEQSPSAVDAVTAAKAAGCCIVAVEQATRSLRPEQLRPCFPVCLVLGSEMRGVSPTALALADCTVEIPMHGMGNSLNVASAAAITLYQLRLAFDSASNARQGRKRSGDQFPSV